MVSPLDHMATCNDDTVPKDDAGSRSGYLVSLIQAATITILGERASNISVAVLAKIALGNKHGDDKQEGMDKLMLKDVNRLHGAPPMTPCVWF